MRRWENSFSGIMEMYDAHQWNLIPFALILYQ